MNSHASAQVPRTCVSTNSTIPAYKDVHCNPSETFQYTTPRCIFLKKCQVPASITYSCWSVLPLRFFPLLPTLLLLEQYTPSRYFSHLRWGYQSQPFTHLLDVAHNIFTMPCLPHVHRSARLPYSPVEHIHLVGHQGFEPWAVPL